MILGIDATNIRAGGGLTHLLEVIAHAKPDRYNISKVIIWGGKQLEKFPARPWLELRKIRALDSSVFLRLFWILFRSKSEFRKHCNILWSPGGTFHDNKIPYVSMSQNMLVFEKEERDRFPWSLAKFRYLFLRHLQARSFRNANGIIFLTQYAMSYVGNELSIAKIPQKIIPHGVASRFRQVPKIQKDISVYSEKNPFKILYVSIVNFYKHQWNLIEAVKILRRQYPVELTLVGPMYEPCESLFYKALHGHEHYIIYKGKVDYNVLSEIYKSSDLFTFCSTCENLPNILIEAMSSGLPILSSSYGPMPEVLQDGGLYCDPLNVDDIKVKLEELITDQVLRSQLAEKSYMGSGKFSWTQCADETFSFIETCSNKK